MTLPRAGSLALVSPVVGRRDLVLGGLGAVLSAGWGTPATAEDQVLRFGLTPVFLTSDLELLTRLRSYLERKTGRSVHLVQRRTYEEITALLISGQLDAAWICGYPFVVYRQQLALVAVPVWRGKPLYRSYLIARSGRSARSLAELQGDNHAFSDPNSNSGYLVTTALLATAGLRPATFFKQTFFTYGHRNVVRAVASGLADSGSVDGYVWEVMRDIEADLTRRTEIVHASDWLGFPPIACPRGRESSAAVIALKAALIGMSREASGREILGLLRLDGFSDEKPELFDAIAAEVDIVRRFG